MSWGGVLSILVVVLVDYVKSGPMYITLLTNVGSRNTTMGCWEFSLTSPSLPNLLARTCVGTLSLIANQCDNIQSLRIRHGIMVINVTYYSKLH
jgi:hypothetical protein